MSSAEHEAEDQESLQAPPRVVVGVDGSPGADAALRWAEEEAERRGAVLVVAHVWSDLPTGRRATPTSALLADVAADLLADAVRSIEDRKVCVEPQLRHGSPAAQLVQAARDAELLVVGSRGHGAVGDLVLGSVSGRCADQATCPVVIIPPGWRPVRR